jgi:hypothetical protein
MNSNPLRPPSYSSISTDLPSQIRIRIQFRYQQDPHLASVLHYLNQQGYPLLDVLKELLKARYAPTALNAEGKLNRAVALESIGKLRGYIYEIEQLAGLASTHENSPKALPDDTINDSAPLTSDPDQESPDSLSAPVPVDLQSIDRMLGFAPSRFAS